MLLHRLKPHPDRPPAARFSVEAAVRRGEAGLWLAEYRVSGDVAALSIAPPDVPERADALWQTTCFELFVRTPGAEGYREFNFAPSGRWAAYAFDGYRAGMRDATVAHAPPIWVCSGDTFDMQVELSEPLAGLEASLTAVIEERDGTKSYWALAHPEGPPDFHADANFRLRLPADA